MVKVVQDGNKSEILSVGDTVVVGSWSGNVRPYQARAYRDGKYIGRTGFCVTESRAVTSACEILSRK